MADPIVTADDLSLWFPQVLAGLLSMADRADWRSCKLSKEEEIQMVDDFKQGFREFDPADWQHDQAANISELDARKDCDSSMLLVHQDLAILCD